MADMGPQPDHQRLAADVLGIRNAPPELARQLVSQALVIEDRREAWRQIGERILAQAPDRPGVYILRDPSGTALYVGKAINVRRRLGAHFATRQWRGLKAPLARVATAEWQEVGSELEALLREAALIRELAPIVNTQIGPPALETRQLSPALVRDVILVVPSIEEDSAELVAARPDGAWFMQRTRRSADPCRSRSEIDAVLSNPTPGRARDRRNEGLCSRQSCSHGLRPGAGASCPIRATPDRAASCRRDCARSLPTSACLASESLDKLEFRTTPRP